MLVLAALSSTAMAVIIIDAKYPNYQRTDAVAGQIKSAGSDTMGNLMSAWGNMFRTDYYPNVTISIESKGSGTAPTALIEGTANFGPMSRPMKESEMNEFEENFGYRPMQMPTAIDMLAIYVHKDNPIAKTGLTLQQIDAIYSQTRKGGYPHDIVTWGDVGLEGDWADKRIRLYGRNSVSGTYGFFKDHALFKGDFKDSVKEQPGSSAVVNSVANDKYGIGYSGIGYRRSDVAVVPVAPTPDGEHVLADENHYDTYPLSRYLYLAINYRPGSTLDPLRAEFLKFIYSREGQQIVGENGYVPLPYAVAKRSLESVGLEMPEKQSEDSE